MLQEILAIGPLETNVVIGRLFDNHRHHDQCCVPHHHHHHHHNWQWHINRIYYEEYNNGMWVKSAQHAQLLPDIFEYNTNTLQIQVQIQ